MGVHHVDAARGSHLGPAALLIPILEIEVHFSSVDVPERIAAACHHRPVLTQEKVVRPLRSLLHGIPLRLDVRTLEELDERLGGLDGFPASLRSRAVVEVEQLSHRIDRIHGSLVGKQPFGHLIGDLRRVGIAQLTAHQALVTLAAVLAHLLAQSRRVLWKSMAVVLAELLALLHNVLPRHGCAVSPLCPLAALHRLHLKHLVEHGCVHHIFLLLVFLQRTPVRKLILREEHAGFLIECYHTVLS